MVAIELVGVVAGVHDANGDDRRVSVFVAPVSDSIGQRDDVTVFEAVDLLVLVSDALLSFLSLPSPL